MSFLNHHIRNALVEVQLADRVPDRERQHQLLQEAINRVAAALSRMSMSGGSSMLVAKVSTLWMKSTARAQEWLQLRAQIPDTRSNPDVREEVVYGKGPS